MEYIEKTTDETAADTESGRIRQIHERVRRIRKSEKAGLKYMQRWEELAYAKEDGFLEGKKEALLQILEMIEPISEELREKIMAVTDAGTLEKWLGIAFRAKSMEEFIEEANL